MFGVRFMKEIDILERYLALKRKDTWINGRDDQIPNLEFVINDNCDVMIKITKIPEEKKEEKNFLLKSIKIKLEKELKEFFSVIYLFIANDDCFDKSKMKTNMMCNYEQSFFKTKIQLMV
jgi:hypothetical protein